MTVSGDGRLPPRALPSVVHADLDCFFAAVEALDRPTLRDRPIVVGGLGPRGVVSTANYAARAFGIGSASPMWQARQAADGRTAFLTPRIAAYRGYSQQVMDVFAAVTALMEPLSLDEAFLDLGAADEPPTTSAEVRDAAAWVKETVRDRLGLTVSLGCATSKPVAKIASDDGKPDGLVVVEAGAEAEFLADRPVGRLPGIGPVAQARLGQAGIRTIADLAGLDDAEATRLLGSTGPRLRRAALGSDTSPVCAPGPAKSASVETTFDVDIRDRARLRAEVDGLVGHLLSRIAASGASAAGVTVKVRLADFRTLTAAVGLGAPTVDPAVLANGARRALDKAATRADLGAGVRLLGVGVHLHHDAGSQAPLFTDDLPSSPPRGPAGVGSSAPTASSAAIESSTARWVAGQDVAHDTHGRGWVQGAGHGLVTVRFESRADLRPGPVRTLAVDDPLLREAGPEPLPPLPDLGTWRRYGAP